MKIQKGPPWDTGVSIRKFGTLSKEVRTEVLVMGGGLAGLLSAYLLAKEGFGVAVVEKNRIGYGATGVTTAMLSDSLDTDFSDLIKIHGTGARKIIDSHREAIDLVEKIVRDEKIECEWMRVSDFIYANKTGDKKYLEKEVRAAKKLGLDAALYFDARFLFRNSGYIEIKGQAKFHPMKFLQGLVESLVAKGVHLFEGTEVTKVHRIEDGSMAYTPKGNIMAGTVISATYEPFGEPLRLFFKKGMYTSYVFELRVPAGTLPEAIYEDMENPYHYMRADKGEDGKFDRVILGGEDHRSDLHVSEKKSFAALEEYAERLFTGIPFEIVRKWSGPILEPIDGLAYIGEQHRIFYAFAFSGNGMTYSAIAAKLFSDLILGKENPYEKIYNVSRLPKLSALFQKGIDLSEELFEGAIKNSLSLKRKK